MRIRWTPVVPRASVIAIQYLQYNCTVESLVLFKLNVGLSWLILLIYKERSQVENEEYWLRYIRLCVQYMFELQPLCRWSGVPAYSVNIGDVILLHTSPLDDIPLVYIQLPWMTFPCIHTSPVNDVPLGVDQVSVFVVTKTRAPLRHLTLHIHPLHVHIHIHLDSHLNASTFMYRHIHVLCT